MKCHNPTGEVVRTAEACTPATTSVSALALKEEAAMSNPALLTLTCRTRVAVSPVLGGATSARAHSSPSTALVFAGRTLTAMSGAAVILYPPRVKGRQTGKYCKNCQGFLNKIHIILN